MIPKKLNKKEFLEVLDRTPLIAIDLIIKDQKNRVLLGKRTNEPAKGMWFVPGGRIFKNESLEDAFMRITETETGNKYLISESKLKGVFNHFYNTNVFGVNGISTHYVVLAYELKVESSFRPYVNKQHSEYKWFEKDSSDLSNVHDNTLAYFDLPQNELSGI